MKIKFFEKWEIKINNLGLERNFFARENGTEDGNL